MAVAVDVEVMVEVAIGASGVFVKSTAAVPIRPLQLPCDTTLALWLVVSIVYPGGAAVSVTVYVSNGNPSTQASPVVASVVATVE